MPFFSRRSSAVSAYRDPRCAGFLHFPSNSVLCRIYSASPFAAAGAARFVLSAFPPSLWRPRDRSNPTEGFVSPSFLPLFPSSTALRRVARGDIMRNTFCLASRNRSGIFYEMYNLAGCSPSFPWIYDRSSLRRANLRGGGLRRT